MIGWITLGALIYLIIGLFVSAFYIEKYEDIEYDVEDDECACVITCLFWPFAILGSIVMFIADLLNSLIRFVRKYIWRKEK